MMSVQPSHALCEYGGFPIGPAGILACPSRMTIHRGANARASPSSHFRVSTELAKADWPASCHPWRGIYGARHEER